MKVRTKYLSYPKFQIVIVTAFLVALTGFFALTIFFMGGSLSELMELGKKAGLSQDHIYFQFLSIQTKSILKNLIYAFIITGLTGSIFFVWFSHNLVGPIIVLIEYLKKYKIAHKQGLIVAPLKFRKRDFFQELSYSVNDVLKLIKIEEVKSEKKESYEA